MDERKEMRRRMREQRLGRFHRSAAVLLGSFLLALIVLGLLAKDRTFSEAENRSLAQRPAISWDALRSGRFFSDASDYLADQFWARDGWISLDTLGSRLWGLREVNGVYLGRDGYLFGAPEVPDEVRQTAKIDAVNAFAARHGDLNVMFLLAPGASAVLEDKLPKNAPIRDAGADIRAVEERLSGVTVLDALSALREHSGEDIYYRTDHHWTSLGAYYAFAAAADRLNASVPVPTFEVYTVSDTFEGTMASRAGVHGVRDSIRIFLPQGSDIKYYVNYIDTQTRVTSMYDSAALEEKDQYTVFFGGNHPIVEIRTTAGTGRSLLVFKDSYANCFMQFLMTYYDTIVMIDPRYYYGDLGAVLTSYGITDVLFLYSADTWMTDSSLPDVLATG